MSPCCYLYRRTEHWRTSDWQEHVCRTMSSDVTVSVQNSPTRLKIININVHHLTGDETLQWRCACVTRHKQTHRSRTLTLSWAPPVEKESERERDRWTVRHLNLKIKDHIKTMQKLTHALKTRRKLWRRKAQTSVRVQSCVPNVCAFTPNVYSEANDYSE